MNRAVGYVLALVLIWYLALFYGCISAHQTEASVGDPPSNEEVKETVASVRCIVSEPTVKGVAITK